MSEQQGPFKVEQIYGFSLLRVTGPAEVARVFTKQDAANKYAADLNLAFLAGQRSADAGLREACGNIPNMAAFVKAARELADVLSYSNDVRDVHYELAALVAADARPGVTRKDDNPAG